MSGLSHQTIALYPQTSILPLCHKAVLNEHFFWFFCFRFLKLTDPGCFVQLNTFRQRSFPIQGNHFYSQGQAKNKSPLPLLLSPLVLEVQQLLHAGMHSGFLPFRFRLILRSKHDPDPQ